MKRLIGIAVVTVLSSLAAVAFAQAPGGGAAPPAGGPTVVPYEPANIQVSIPAGWTSAAQEDKASGQAILVAQSADQEAGLVYAVIDAKNLQKAMKGLDKKLKEQLTGIKKGKFKKVKLNGMAGMSADGSAKTKDGKDVAMFLLLIQPLKVKGKIVLVLGMVNAAKKADFLEPMKGALAGIQPLK